MTIPVHNDPLQSASEPQVVQPPIKIAAAYVRVASLHERPNEYAQVLQIREFAVQYGFLLDAVYTDYGWGSSRPPRKGLDDLFLAAKDGLYQFIIVTDHTRMFENIRLYRAYQDFFWRRNWTEFISLAEVRGLLA